MDIGLGMVLRNSADFDRHFEVLAGGQNFTPELLDSEIYSTALRLGRLAEPLGFNSIWTTEHHFTPYMLVPNPVSLLTYFAACSEELDMGTMVIVTPWHNPIRVAEDIVHLDLVLEGRKFYPGLGRGITKQEYEGLGIPREESRSRFTECLDIVRLALSGEAFSYEGKHFRIPRVELRPKPRSNPQELIDRLYMAWGSPESMPLAAELGLKPLINPQRAWDAYVQELTEFQRIRTKAGFAPARPIAVSWVICAPTVAEAEAQANLYYRQNADGVLRHYQIGDSSQFENVKGYETYARKAKEMQDGGDQLNKMTENNMKVYTWGTPEMCYEKLTQVNDKLAVEHLVVCLNFGAMPPNVAEANMRLFASEVLPALKKLPVRPIVGITAK
jgi:alkanesulfonate monooxygenase SsuD/methylene tetrahydromethanopterin reductase-like flavin-dependent oxidoreductase (luciferase family)